MRIESILRRPGGTRVTLDGVEYHFVPDAEGREFCDVSNPEHVKILLAIQEGYRAAEASKTADLPKMELTTVEPLAPAEEAPTEEVPATEAPATDDRDYWVEQYQARFGRKPHGKWPIERIRAELEAIV